MTLSSTLENNSLWLTLLYSFQTSLHQVKEHENQQSRGPQGVPRLASSSSSMLHTELIDWLMATHRNVATKSQTSLGLIPDCLWGKAQPRTYFLLQLFLRYNLHMIKFNVCFQVYSSLDFDKFGQATTITIKSPSLHQKVPLCMFVANNLNPFTPGRWKPATWFPSLSLCLF